MMMYIIPWRISDFLGTGIERPAMDHLGFEVESVDAFSKDLEELTTNNPHMSPKATGIGAEGEARLKTFKKTGLGDLYFADPDGVFIAVKERSGH